MPYGTRLRYRLAVLVVVLPLALTGLQHSMHDLVATLSGARPAHGHQLTVQLSPFPQLRVVAATNDVGGVQIAVRL